jgi:hypothetical protein
MIKSKQSNISRSELLRLLQATSFKKIYIHEPYFSGDEKALLDLLKQHKSEQVSIIIGVSP